VSLLGEPGSLHNEMINDQPILVFLNQQGDTVRVLSRRVNGQVLTFTSQGQDPVTDRETQSVWDLQKMIALDGELKGSRLTPFPFTYSRWAAWQHYRPDTLLAEQISN
ncbi:MAG: DUF3179 domain-containing protein, partial [Acidobacteriota bacterium]